MPNRSASRITITVAFGHVDADLDDGGGHEHVEIAPAERTPSSASFSAERQAAVQQPEPQAVQLAVRQPLEGLLGRRHLELLALVDQRAHHVRLAARRRLRRARRPTPRPPAADPAPSA